jgi:hypothetical protein
MTDQSNLQEFEDLFGSDTPEVKIEEDGSIPFNELSDELSETIANIPDKGVEIEVPKKEENVDIIPEEVVEEIAKEKDAEEIMQEEMVKEKQEKIEKEWIENKRHSNSLSKEEEEIVSKGRSAIEQVKGNQNDSLSDEDDIIWYFDSPTPMYDSFYNEKRKGVRDIVRGEQIKYYKWMKELGSEGIRIDGDAFDKYEVMKGIAAVQQLRERIKYIHLQCNLQYFSWKRFIEILRGCLARVEYIKPQIKQDGLAHEHMGDIEAYWNRLEALRDSIVFVEKNLAAVYESLSRKVSIFMELKTGDRYEPRTQNSYEANNSSNNDDIEKSNSHLDEYDDLPSGAQASQGRERPKEGKVAWGDIN